MSKLRIGVVGAGGITTAHLPHLQERNDAVELVGVADVNAEAAAALAAKYSMPFQTTDWRELLPQVDAVLVCIPTSLHHEVVKAALLAKVAVFSEKPFTRTLEDAEELAKIEAETGVPLQVGFVRRFDTEWLSWGKAVTEEEAIGRPLVWRDAMGSTRPGFWFCQDDLGGGPYLDGCIHNLDFALMTFGPAEWIFCHGRTLGEGNTAIDTGTATVHFKSGDELMLAWSWGLPKGCSTGRLFEFLGPKGTVSWPRETEGYNEAPFYLINNGDSKREVPFSPMALGDGFKLQMDEFIEVAQGKMKPRAGSAEGIASLKLGLAIIESARTNQIVRL